MASITVLFLSLVTITVCQFGFNSALRLEVTPKTINELVTEEVSLTCIANDSPYWSQTVEIMEMGRKGDKPIVILNQRKTRLDPKFSLTSRIQAEGCIDKNVTQSYVKITIKDPGMADAGAYVCRLFYMDASGDLKEGKVFGNVTVDNDDNKPVLIHLLNRLTNVENITAHHTNTIESQEKTLQIQGQKLIDQKTTIDSLEQTVQIQGQKLVDQKTTIDSLEKTVQIQGQKLVDQKTTIESQEKTLQIERQKLKDHDNIIQQQSNLIDDQRKQTRVLKEEVAKQDVKTTYSCAFSYGYNGDTFAAAQTLLFTQLIMSVGDGYYYNVNTGTFTAPKKGLYVFSLVMSTYESGDLVYVDLKANNNVIATVFADDEKYWEQSSSTTVVSLEAGDNVKPVVRSFTGHNRLESSDHYSIFSGYLLRLL